MTSKSLLIVLTMFLFGCASTTVHSNPVTAPQEPAQVVGTDMGLAWSSSVAGIETASTAGDELIIVRVDAKQAPLVLLNPPETNGRSVRENADANGLALAINAAMFGSDYQTSIGYMRNYQTINNGHYATRLKGYLLFNPKNPKSAAVKIAEKDDPNYQTVFQTHRMWTPALGILWNQGAHAYFQVALVGVDSKNRALFFYHPATIDVHDLVQSILDLNLGLKGLLYLDGGHHGVLHLAPEVGASYNAGMPLPNIIGVKPPAAE